MPVEVVVRGGHSKFGTAVPVVLVVGTNDCGAGTMGMTCGTLPAATAPHCEHVGGGGGMMPIHAPMYATTWPPQMLQVPTHWFMVSA